MANTNGNRDPNYRSQELFWAKLGQLKFDLIFYCKHFSYCVVFLRWLRIGTAVLTVFATGAWMQWKEYTHVSTICFLIILVLQGLNAGAEFLPFDSRKHELRELINMLEPILNEMERDWSRIFKGELAVEEIEEKTYIYQNRRLQIGKNYFKNDSIPRWTKLVEKAKKETDDYMSALG